MQFDFAIVGGGIVGLSAAMHLSQARPGATMVLVEKEDRLAAHQSGHNSGVIHAGAYYAPGSLKARFCREGVEATIRFCRERGLRFEQCGKLIVATHADEIGRLDALFARARENGLDVTRLDAAELKAREPRIAGVGAIFVPTTGITDYPAIARAMGVVFEEAGGEVRLGSEVRAIREEPAGVVIATTRGDIRARHLVVCGGLHADCLARMCGIDTDFAIVPFRGEYYRLGPDKDEIVRHLIYPVPDPALPFLGVHLTRMIGGYMTVGPNAVLAAAREGYRRRDINLRDIAEMATFPGLRRLLAQNFRYGLSEMHNSLSRSRYLALCQRYCPELTLADLKPYAAGVRAQAVLRDGTMVHDFMLQSTARTLHVCNAPSPAATASIPIGRHIAAEAERLFFG